MGNQNLYFIAIVLPDELCKQVVEIQNEIADRYQSQKSLKVIPHITLKAPFVLPAFSHHHVISWFSDLIVGISPFTIELKDFDSFRNPKQPVIYIKPLPSKALSNLQKMIIQEFYKTFDTIEIGGTELSYKPHVTVAYRDLKPKMFELAWPEFKVKNFSGEFLATGFQLLKHDGKMWHVIEHHLLT